MVGERIRNISIAIFVFVLTTILFADHNQHLFEQANKLYEQEKYEQAILKYKEILANGYESWELYYNLGNAYYKNKQLGRAILNYERAYALENKNEDVNFNLEMANLMVADKINTPPDFLLFKIFSEFKKYFGLNTLTIFVLVSYLIGIVILISWIFIRERKIRRLLFITGIPVIIFCLVFSAVLVVRVHELNTYKYGIIMADKVEVRSSPEQKSTELFSLHEGVKVRVEKSTGEWFQIRLRDGKVGWMEKRGLEII